MQLIAGPRSIELTEVVLCSQGLFSEGPDKVGAVLLERESGRLDGRTALALVQTARALAVEYPSDVIAVGPEAGLTAGEHPEGTVLAVGRSEGGVVVAARLPLSEVPQALAILEKYLTRLTRLDTP